MASIFSTKNNTENTSGEYHLNEITRIAAGANLVQASLESDNDIRIDGNFQGTIRTKGKLVIGEQAVVNGNIVCENMDVWGNLQGDILVGDILTLLSTADYRGNMRTMKISIEKGARFTGNCEMITRQEFESASGFVAPVLEAANVVE